MRILIVSNMNASQPYGAWTRPYYLGEALSNYTEVVQLGFDTSDVTYAPARSIRSKDIPAYLRAIRSAALDFKPDVIYCHETFPAMAAHLAARLDSLAGRRHPALVFDIHALHAAEYKAMLNYYRNSMQGLFLFAKSYYSQRLIARSGAPLIAASSELKTMLVDWYGIDQALIHVVPNGAPSAFITTPPPASKPVHPGFA